MAALGEFLIFIIYFVLGSALVLRIFLAWQRKEELNRGLKIKILLISLPLIFFSSWTYYVKRTDELQNVGKYVLTEYPNCNPCMIELNSNNIYKITSESKIIEEGEWTYLSGGDYWIVKLGSYGQLGAGFFKYSHKLE